MRSITLWLDEVDLDKLVKLAEKDQVSLETRAKKLLHLGIVVALKEHVPQAGIVPSVDQTLDKLYSPGTRNVYPGPDALPVLDSVTGVWTAKARAEIKDDDR